MAQQLLPYGYDFFVIGGWSMGGQVDPDGVPVLNATQHYSFLDEYGRPVPDASRFPSAMAGSGAGDCSCEARNCSDPDQYECTDPVCICRAGTRTMRPFADHLSATGLRLGLWTWRGVHKAAAKHRLRVKGTNYTADEITDRDRNGNPCWHGNCDGQCPWGPWLGVNASHPGARAYYESLYGQFVDDWGAQFIKADCQDWPSERWGELSLQADAVKGCKGTAALSWSPGVFGGETPDGGQRLAREQLGTMYRVTTDFWGSWGAIAAPGGRHGHGGSLGRASAHANASLIGANGTFPDLDIMPLGQVKCDARRIPATVQNPQCGCLNCNGSDMAYTIASLWSVARSPLLLGGALPLDTVTMNIVSNPDFLRIHGSAQGHRVFEFTQANTSDPSQQGWVKWAADVAEGTAQRAKVVLLVNIGNEAASTRTTWTQLQLPPAPHAARDVWTGQALATTTEGFQLTLGPHNATIVVVSPAA
eukprot:TRINITY_DN23159_c0_g1_i1.p1 TRINITY_DN23159_c0_g1~~TRINITY_DN23159_c0_g1_i1.p1  ORF type:complete len:552 (+),score=169.65 TRINITY_DN23159_c0_g1_i1:230-1657(+)